MMKYLVCLLVLSCCIGCISVGLSGNQSFRGRYQDKLPAEEEVLYEDYTSTISKTTDGRYVYRTYFPETRTLTRETYFLDRKLTTAHGSHRHFYDNGIRRAVGAYDNGKATGPWVNYSLRSGGGKESEGTYTDGIKSGEWISYDGEGRIKDRINYVQGKEDGRAIYFDSTNQVTNEIIYSKGDIVSETNPFVDNGEPERMPLFKGCEEIEDYKAQKVCADRKMLEYIYSNIRYPMRARNNGAQGMAVISFIVEKDGSISEPLVIDGITQDISDELMRLVTAMPDWHPGMQQGKFVRVQFNLPVKFRLE